MWRGDYEELEEVVGRLEEEGEKKWMSKKRGEKGSRRGREWKEMGRLAREIGWEIEKRKRMEGGEGRGGDMITLHGMKKNLEEEKKGREEEKKRADEEKRRADEEEKKKEEEKKGRAEEKRMKEEEKKKRVESERKAKVDKEQVEREKQELEDRLKRMAAELEQMKKRNKDKDESTPNYQKIVHLTSTQTVTFGYAEISGETISVTSDSKFSNCRIGQIYSSVCNLIINGSVIVLYVGSSSTVFLSYIHTNYSISLRTLVSNCRETGDYPGIGLLNGNRPTLSLGQRMERCGGLESSLFIHFHCQCILSFLHYFLFCTGAFYSLLRLIFSLHCSLYYSLCRWNTFYNFFKLYLQFFTSLRRQDFSGDQSNL